MNMMSPLVVTADHTPLLTRSEVAGLVALAARSVAPLWPLESAIAVNPLSGLEEHDFASAVKIGAAQFGARQSLPLFQWRRLLGGRIDARCLRDAAIRHLGGLEMAMLPVAPKVTRLDLLMAMLVDLPIREAHAGSSHPAQDVAFLAKWCAAYFDQGFAAMPMPYRELGLYRAVLALAAHDAEFAALAGERGMALLLTVPRDPLEAIAEALAVLDIAAEDHLDQLCALVSRLPGWAGHIRWHNEHADPDFAEAAPATMADLLALWLLIARAGALSASPDAAPAKDASSALAAHFGLSHAALARAAGIATLDEATLGALFMVAAEWTYRNPLVPQLQRAAQAGAPDSAPADAQLVFCIDVRSEPFRRALEAQGRYETLGYAGFFGLPIAVHRFGEKRRRRFLPVLLSPRHDVAEAPAPGREVQAAALAQSQEEARHAVALFDSAKRGGATAFATAEATGPLAAAVMAVRTLAPRLVEKIAGALAPARDDTLAPALHHHDCPSQTPVFTLEEKVGYAMALFRLTGLSGQTARIVALVGHGASAVNNPYAASLDCGACGGHAGGSNARILAAMLNEPEVRAGLAAQGIAIPATTRFLAGEHNTTTDEVTLFDRESVPESHQTDLARLTTSLARAGKANRQRRAALLGRSEKDLLTGAVHWGEVRPEWGLSGNAGFIVGPRWLSQQIDLEGRAFLHSYEWQSDADGSALATILTAPMVVAQWINCQYLFSTLDNDRYGSGDKVTQNIVGGIGVLQGNGGDLKTGLPHQSLFRDDGTPFHVPQRLLTVVHAPFARVQQIVAAHDVLARLFGKGWVTLVVIDPETGRTRRWATDSELSSSSCTETNA